MSGVRTGMIKSTIKKVLQNPRLAQNKVLAEFQEEGTGAVMKDAVDAETGR